MVLDQEQIDHIEIVASDDGVEFFGGTHDISHLLVINKADDGIDLDQNYAGTISNFFVIHTGGKGSNAGFEFDGPEGSTYLLENIPFKMVLKILEGLDVL